MKRSSRITAVMLLTACQACGPAQEKNTAELGPTIETRLGALEGTYADTRANILAFRGVPYARPPVGDLRWKPPKPPEPWEGTRSARAPGSPCWQPITPETSIYSRGPMDRNEDCLYLDLWTPAESLSDRLPVMVWFHGGSHTTGHGSSPVFDGTALARQGVILVSANYRLGALGFMAHPALTAESPRHSSGNYGILDKVAVLQWVEDHITSFGGNPDNVTIFGQSAGSASVCTLMASPLARGLFHRAIGHSASCMAERPDLEPAERRGLRWAAALGISGEAEEATKALRSARPEEILEASEAPEAAEAGSPGIIVDGWVVPRSMRAIFEASEHHHVPLITGWMADEGTALFAAIPELPRPELESTIRQRYGNQAEAILAEYEDQIAESPRKALQSIQADDFFGWGGHEWLSEVVRAGNHGYLYFFSQAPPVFNLYLADRPPLDIPEGPRGYGAYHSGDLAYAFANLDRVGHGWTDADREISRVMSAYWVNFAKTGDPNGSGLPTWPRFEPGSSAAIELGIPIRAVSGIRGEKLALFAATHSR